LTFPCPSLLSRLVGPREASHEDRVWCCRRQQQRQLGDFGGVRGDEAVVRRTSAVGALGAPQLGVAFGVPGLYRKKTLFRLAREPLEPLQI